MEAEYWRRSGANEQTRSISYRANSVNVDPLILRQDFTPAANADDYWSLTAAVTVASSGGNIVCFAAIYTDYEMIQNTIVYRSPGSYNIEASGILANCANRLTLWAACEGPDASTFAWDSVELAVLSGQIEGPLLPATPSPSDVVSSTPTSSCVVAGAPPVGEQALQNGDFVQGFDHWNIENQSPQSQTVTVEDGQA